MKPKKTLLSFGFPLMLTIALPLSEQTGCVGSHEVEMTVLALAGAAGLLLARMFTKRLF
ncbi:MAG TPA: PExPT-CTERM protein [Silvibacterium sp.]|nr:PExPT-CTERM protein [Silvibacterium sp.]